MCRDVFCLSFFIDMHVISWRRIMTCLIFFFFLVLLFLLVMFFQEWHPVQCSHGVVTPLLVPTLRKASYALWSHRRWDGFSWGSHQTLSHLGNRQTLYSVTPEIRRCAAWEDGNVGTELASGGRLPITHGRNSIWRGTQRLPLQFLNKRWFSLHPELS